MLEAILLSLNPLENQMGYFRDRMRVATRLQQIPIGLQDSHSTPETQDPQEEGDL